MPEQIIINIVRPEVGIEYIPASRENSVIDWPRASSAYTHWRNMCGNCVNVWVCPVLTRWSG